MSHAPGPVTCFPELDGAPCVAIQEGWDSEVFAVDDQIVRIPRRPEVETRARVETRLLPVLQASLPVDVPLPLASCPEHGAMRYARIRGDPATPDRLGSLRPEMVGEQLSRLLDALRAVPTEAAHRAGIPDLSASRWQEGYVALAARFARTVLPHLPDDHREEALVLLDEARALPGDVAACIVHADLGPSHLLCDDRGLRGVIDWGDVRLGDPAVDLAWVLNGTPEPVGEVVRDRLALDDDEVTRARLYHRLGPWYEVEHGLRIGDERFIASGVRGAVGRLAGWTPWAGPGWWRGPRWGGRDLCRWDVVRGGSERLDHDQARVARPQFVGRELLEGSVAECLVEPPRGGVLGRRVRAPEGLDLQVLLTAVGQVLFHAGHQGPSDASAMVWPLHREQVDLGAVRALSLDEADADDRLRAARAAIGVPCDVGRERACCLDVGGIGLSDAEPLGEVVEDALDGVRDGAACFDARKGVIATHEATIVGRRVELTAHGRQPGSRRASALGRVANHRA